MKRLANIAAIIFATLAMVYLLWQFRLIVGLFMVSLFVAAAIRPSIIYLTERGLSVASSRIIVYVSIIGFIVLSFYVLSAPFSQEVRKLSNRTAIGYQNLYNEWSSGTEWQQSLAARSPDPTALFETADGEEGDQLIQTILNLTQDAFTLVGGVITVLILSIYWSSDQERFERLWLSVLPAEKRIRARDSWRQIEVTVGGYLRSQIVQSLLAATLLGLGYWLMGLDYPVLLAIIAAVTWFIPIAGVVLISLPVFFVGFNFSLSLGLGAVLYTIVIILLLEIALEPRIFDRRRYSTFLLLLTMIPLVDVFGFVGFIIAPPLAAAIQVILGQIFQYRVHPMTTTVHLKELEARYLDVSETLRENYEEMSSPELSSMLERLRNLLLQAKDLAVQE
jgi:predicted PurR-regulated permease PerM